MSEKENDIRAQSHAAKTIESWPKSAKAMDAAGKKLVGRYGKSPIPGNAIMREASETTGLNASGLQPSDYCYNSRNKDPRSNRWNVFLKVGHGLYEYVGPLFEFKGETSSNPLMVEPARRRTTTDQETLPPLPENPLKSDQIEYEVSENKNHRILLKKLLERPALPFDKRFELHVPDEPGIYGIRRKGGKFLHAGVSHKAGLRKRLFSQHLNGGGKGAASDFVQKVQDRGMASNRRDAKLWIRQNCVIYCLPESDKSARTWAEHHMLAELQPLWGS
jgi:hypothetical protein